MAEGILEETKYDAIVLGTGILESILAGAISKAGKKVLHLDKNEFYGGTYATLTLTEFKRHLQAQEASDSPSSRGKYKAIFRKTVKAKKTIEVEEKESEVEKEEKSSQQAVTGSVTTGESSQAPPQDPVLQSAGADLKEDTKSSEVTEKKEETTVETTVATKKAKVVKKEIIEDVENPLIKQWEGGSRSSIFLDTFPKILFASSELVDMIIESGVHSYLEFRSFHHVNIFMNGKFVNVPCSKGDVFKNSSISLIEKRYLMKFLNLCLPETGKASEEDEKLLEEYKDKPFVELLKACKLSDLLTQFITFSIAFLDADNYNTITTEAGTERIQRFISSLMRYKTNTPFLYPLYGSSEIPQAFCRLAAVFSTTYVLRRSARQIIYDPSSQQYKGIVCSAGQTLTSDWLITNLENYSEPQLITEEKAKEGSSAGTETQEDKKKETTNEKFYSICYCVTDKSLVEGDQTCVLVIPPLSINQNQKDVIYLTQFDHTFNVVPKEQFLVIAHTMGNESSEKDLEDVINNLFALPSPADSVSFPDPSYKCISQETQGKPQAHFCLYVNQPMKLSNQISAEKKDLKNVYLNADGDTDEAIGFGNLVSQAKKIFEQICPGVTFFPQTNPFEEANKEELNKAKDEDKAEQDKEANKQDNEKKDTEVQQTTKEEAKEAECTTESEENK